MDYKFAVLLFTVRSLVVIVCVITVQLSDCDSSNAFLSPLKPLQVDVLFRDVQIFS